MGVGRNKSLKQLKVIYRISNRTKKYNDRYEIENITINHNRKHFKKAHSSKIYDNSIYELLPNYSTREKIFNETLDKNNCGDEDVRIFLNLLQCKDLNNRTHHILITELEWENIVKNPRKKVLLQFFLTETMQCKNANWKANDLQKN